MFRTTPARTFANYVVAVTVSILSVVILWALQPLLGFVPMLLLLTIAAVATFSGVGAAAVSLVVCFLGALALGGDSSFRQDYFHNVANLIAFPLVAAALMYLIEMRRRDRWLDFEFSVLLDNMPEAVLVVDARGRVIEANRAAVAMTGMSREQLVRTRLPDLAHQFGARRDGHPMAIPDLAISRALRGEIVRDEDRVLKRRDHEDEIEALVSATPIRDAQDEVVGAMLVLRDVTEVSALHRRVADTERHRAIGQMAAGIAHDFNNVLDTISQAAAVLELRAEEPTAKRAGYLRIINNSVARGTEIIGRVREYIRGGSGEMTVLDLSQIMNEAAELSLPLLRREERKIMVVRELKPTAKVKGNAADLRRALTNLIINAVDAMPAGGTLTLSTEQHGQRVIATVRDSGNGIPENQQQKIFSPYFTTKKEGTGLGLSGAQRIVLAHQGDIRFHSESGRGTTFIIDLPAAEAQQNGDHEKAA
jgi:PAS domain S-box-containing protein